MKAVILSGSSNSLPILGGVAEDRGGNQNLSNHPCVPSLTMEGSYYTSLKATLRAAEFKDKCIMKLIVRQGTQEDISAMCSLLSELFSIEADFSPDLQKQSTGLSLLLNDKSDLSIVLVAEKDDEIIGMCSVQTLISTAEGGPVGLLEDLIVRKEHRGNGIGTRLLSEIFRWCATKNISRLQLLRHLDNKRALKFYAGNGWAETRLVCMRKTL